MNAPTRLPVVHARVIDDVRDTIEGMRKELLQLMHTAEMVRQRALTPNWDTDIAIPTQRLNSALFFIEDMLQIEGKGAP